MNKDRWIKVVGAFTILGAISAMIVVPEFRKLIGLETSSASPTATKAVEADSVNANKREDRNANSSYPSPKREDHNKNSPSSSPSVPPTLPKPSPLAPPYKLSVFDVKASSFIYTPLNVVDGETRTSTWNNRWISKRGDMEGSWIELHLPDPKLVTSIRVYMVIQDNDAGCQIRDADLIFSDGSKQSIRLPFEKGWQEVKINEVTTSYIRFLVKSIYPSGGSWNKSMDVFEIELYGKDGA